MNDGLEDKFRKQQEITAEAMEILKNFNIDLV
jgi:hypothetical protein